MSAEVRFFGGVVKFQGEGCGFRIFSTSAVVCGCAGGRSMGNLMGNLVVLRLYQSFGGFTRFYVGLLR